VHLCRHESLWKRFWRFACKGFLFPKRSTFAWKSSTTSDFRPRCLRDDYKSRKVKTGWRTYGMLTFHYYRWNQVKVIHVACTARTRREPCPKNTLLRRPVLLAKWRRIANSFAWRRYLANIEVALLLTSEYIFVYRIFVIIKYFWFNRILILIGPWTPVFRWDTGTTYIDIYIRVRPFPRLGEEKKIER